MDILNQIEDIKHKLTSEEYKNIVEECQKIYYQHKPSIDEESYERDERFEDFTEILHVETYLSGDGIEILCDILQDLLFTIGNNLEFKPLWKDFKLEANLDIKYSSDERLEIRNILGKVFFPNTYKKVKMRTNSRSFCFNWLI